MEMTGEPFRELVALLALRISKNDTSFRKAIPVEKRVAVGLWRPAISSATTGNFFIHFNAFLFRFFSNYSVFWLSDFEIIEFIVNSLIATFIEMPMKKENLREGYTVKFSFRAFHEIKFQGDFMKQEILS